MIVTAHDVSASVQEVQVLTSAEYFAQYWSHVPVVSDLHASIQQSKQAAAAEGLPSRNAGSYKPHLSAHSLQQALNSGTAVQVYNMAVVSKRYLVKDGSRQ